MRQKTMKLWQMILVIVLSLVMVVTMFLPAFKINGDAFGKAVEESGGDAAEDTVKKAAEAAGLDGGALGDMVEDAFGNIAGEAGSSSVSELVEDLPDSIDSDLGRFEEKNHVKITKISPFQIMTHSLTKLIYGDGLTEEEIQEKESQEWLAQINKSYKLIRFLLWTVYIVALIIILITVLGFLLKWNKLVPLIISAVYGLAAAIIFGYLRFGLMGSIEKRAGDILMERMTSYVNKNFPNYWGPVPDNIIENLLPRFHSIAFLIAFIVALCIIVASVLSMFLGKTAEYMEPDYEEPGYGGSNLNGNDNVPLYHPNGGEIGSGQNDNNPFADQMGGQQTGTQPVPPVPPVPPVIPARSPVMAAPMGQVRCTKGIMTGQGLMLPQDRKVIVGKSPQKANLVINNQNVSNIHCSIRYNPATNRYIVKDHSTNGTFVNGVRLVKGNPSEYPAGTVLSLADGSNEITLG